MDQLQRSLELLKRVPSTPYPGLRPFLDHEDMLLHGRERQIGQVTARLVAQGRFVAVLGGSGSGKSSLVRAGVVPMLRRGTHGAGDLWETVVCTPGTNFEKAAQGRQQQSPITRLAWEFCAVLADPDVKRPGDRTETDVKCLLNMAIEDRRRTIEEQLRQPGGLDNVIANWGHSLSLPGGGDPRQACVLVVIDQFEELFHSSNRNVRDAHHLINRVIEHYHLASQREGCPRCFVAITMRTEHLQDCAAHIGLPGAINTSAYLVSRLDERELRSVIEGPASRFLKLRQRLAPDDESLPDKVEFEQKVVARLIADTVKIADKPDHLPLLQHLLARIWQQACRDSSACDGGFPREISERHLWAAAKAPLSDGPLATEADLQDSNTLESSLQEWAQFAFDKQPSEREELAALFRLLAYRDPVSGTYSQQRLNLPADESERKKLYELLDKRWIHSVNYLFWDDRNPDSATLKVSHESFIRNWKYFRDLVDFETLRFERFHRLLADCHEWLGAPGELLRRTLLLDEGQLQRIADARVPEALLQDSAQRLCGWDRAWARARGYLAGKLSKVSDGLAWQWRKFSPLVLSGEVPPLWHKWHAWLEQLPDGERLGKIDPASVQEYYLRSQDRVHNKQWTLVGLACVTLLGLGWIAFSLLIQQPVIDNTNVFIDSADKTSLIRVFPESESLGANHLELAKVLDTVDKFEKAQTNVGWGALGMVLPKAKRTVEPQLNGTLRSLLVSRIWRTPPKSEPSAVGPEDGTRQKNKDPLMAAPRDVTCQMPKEPSECGIIPGRFVFDRIGGDCNSKGLWITSAMNPTTGGAYILPAEIRKDGSCTTSGTLLRSLPKGSVGFDKGLNHLLMVSERLDNGSGEKGRSEISVARVLRDVDGNIDSIETDFAVVTGDNDATKVLQDQLDQNVGALLEWNPMFGGRAWRVGKESWRIVSSGMISLSDVDSAGLDTLTKADARNAPACLAITRRLKEKIEGSSITTLADADYCLIVIGLPPAPHKARSLFQVYAIPLSDDLTRDSNGEKLDNGRAVPLLFSTDLDLSAADVGTRKWKTGKLGTPYAGWLVYATAEGGTEIAYKGVAWSTSALKEIGKSVLIGHCRTLTSEEQKITGCPNDPLPGPRSSPPVARFPRSP